MKLDYNKVSSSVPTHEFKNTPVPGLHIHFTTSQHLSLSTSGSNWMCNVRVKFYTAEQFCSPFLPAVIHFMSETHRLVLPPSSRKSRSVNHRSLAPPTAAVCWPVKDHLASRWLMRVETWEGFSQKVTCLSLSQIQQWEHSQIKTTTGSWCSYECHMLKNIGKCMCGKVSVC